MFPGQPRYGVFVDFGAVKDALLKVPTKQLGDFRSRLSGCMDLHSSQGRPALAEGHGCGWPDDLASWLRLRDACSCDLRESGAQEHRRCGWQGDSESLLRPVVSSE